MNGDVKYKKAKDILNYWDTIEFLTQSKYNKPIYKNVDKQKKTYKELQGDDSIIDIKEALSNTLKDCIEVDTPLNWMENINQEMASCGMEYHVEILVYIGLVKRESCIKYISEQLSINYTRIEKNEEEIVLASICLNEDGSYKDKSLEISPIVWYISQIENGKTIIDDLQRKAYISDVKKIEKKVFCIEDCNDTKKACVSGDKINQLFEYIKDKFIPSLSDNGTPIEPKEKYGFEFRMYKDFATKSKAKKEERHNGIKFDFYSSDINLVVSNLHNRNLVDDTILDYINVLDNESNLKAQRLDLLNAYEKGDNHWKEILKIMDLNNAPLGKWPSRHKLGFMQQAAIIYSLECDSIFSVNGPPGTGKTTLVKDIIVNNIVERAKLIAKYEHPDDAFMENNFKFGPYSNGAYDNRLGVWYSIKDDHINDYSILVASNNNNAVENITRELPKNSKIVEELSPRIGDSNRQRNKLDEIRKLFDANSDEELQHIDEDEEGKNVYFTKYAKKLFESDDIWGLITAPLGKKVNIDNFYFKCIRDFIKENPIDDNNDHALEEYQKARDEFNKQLEKVVNSKSDNCDKCNRYNKQHIQKLYSNDYNESVKAHTELPWVPEVFNRRREKLFYHALKLHEKFILASNCCKVNLMTLAQYWKLLWNNERQYIDFHEADCKEFVPALYQTLSLLVPVISSTFASIGTMFKDIEKPKTFGTLIIDEASQAQPYMALGSIYRCRKAIVIGDPQQLQPIVPSDVKQLFCFLSDSVSDKYQDSSLSVQLFADMINRYGTYMNHGNGFVEWKGCPLLVHRRCLSPMFEISNEVSYNGTMKQQTELPAEDLQAKMLYPQSRWINICGKEKSRYNHFVELQGIKVRELLEKAFKESDNPDILVISPFVTVVNGIKTFIKENAKRFALSELDAKYDEAWIDSHIGTVHSFQGREASEVIFVLGCDDSREATGAIRWINSNLVNVAVTRAKHRIYVIGDGDAWSESNVVKKVKKILDSHALIKIDSILENADMSEPDKKIALMDAMTILPTKDAFHIAESETEEGYDIDTGCFIESFDEDFINKEFSNAQLQRFGFNSMNDLNRFKKKIRDNIVLGMRIYFLLEELYKYCPNLDASCCGILFCKAIELRLKECFINKLKEKFPQHKVGNGKILSQISYDKISFGHMNNIIAAHYKDFANKGDSSHNKEWWRNYQKKLENCTIYRNKCCHADLFTWDDQEKLLNLIFQDETTQYNNGDNILKMRGLLYESEAGKHI